MQDSTRDVDVVDDAEDSRRREQIRAAAERGNTEDGAAFYTPRSDGPWYSGNSGALRAPATELRARALDANEKTERMPDAGRERMATELEADPDPEARLARYTLEASNPHYYKAFAKWFNDPISGGHEWSPDEREAVARVRMLERALGLGSQGGSFMTPYELDPAILVSSAGTRSPLREIARVDTTAFNTKKYVTSAGVTATWTPEAQQQTDDSPTLLQPSIDCKKGAAFVPVSFELAEDSNIAQEVGALFADAKANQENLSFTLTQANGPVGLISAVVTAASGVIATGTNVLAQGDLYANQAALPPRWRPNAKWMMNLSILNGFRQLPQATGLNYSIVSDATDPPKILGWDVYENSSMDGTLTGAAADYLVLSGDFSQFAIVDRIGSSVEVIPNLVGAAQRPTLQRGYLLHWRVGSDALIPSAFSLSNYST